MNPSMSSSSNRSGALPSIPLKFQNEKTVGPTAAGLPNISKVSSHVVTAKMRDAASASRVDIHTPALRPDNAIHRFEENLKESVGLLRNYQNLLEQSKRVEEELERGKNETITALVKQLVQRKQDHSVICKCLAIMNTIRSEFEYTKQKLAEDARRQLLQIKRPMEDKAIQCEIQDDLSSYKPVYTSVHLAKQTSWSILESQGASAQEAGSGQGQDKANDINNYNQASMLSYYPVRKKSKSRCKVHFDPENIQESDSQSSNSSRIQVSSVGHQKRVPLGTTSVNIYHNVIPESSLKHSTQELTKRDTNSFGSAIESFTPIFSNIAGYRIALPNTSIEKKHMLQGSNCNHLANTFYKQQSSNSKIGRKSRSLKKSWDDEPRSRVCVVKTKSGTSIERSMNGKPLVQTILNYTKIDANNSKNPMDDSVRSQSNVITMVKSNC